jgi:hypothetical protein
VKYDERKLMQLSLNRIYFLSLFLDQRVVYNFLEQINNEQEKKEFDRTLESARGKSLDDILTNLKK